MADKHAGTETKAACADRSSLTSLHKCPDPKSKTYHMCGREMHRGSIKHSMQASLEVYCSWTTASLLPLVACHLVVSSEKRSFVPPYAITRTGKDAYAIPNEGGFECIFVGA